MPIPKFAVVAFWIIVWLWIVVWAFNHQATVAAAWHGFWHVFGLTTGAAKPASG